MQGNEKPYFRQVRTGAAGGLFTVVSSQAESGILVTLLLYSDFVSAREDRAREQVLISLQQLEKRPVQFKVDVPAGEIEFDSKLTQSSVLHAEGTAELLNHTLGEIRVEGKLAVTMVATCDRCLEPATFLVENGFDLIYMPAEDSTGGEKEVDEGAIEVGFYEGDGIVLNDIFREVVLLALPMQMVCEEACKGICPVCGENRNKQTCSCQPRSGDDRWSQLEKLRAEIGLPN